MLGRGRAEGGRRGVLVRKGRQVQQARKTAKKKGTLLYRVWRASNVGHGGDSMRNCVWSKFVRCGVVEGVRQ
jgi:hypothetical protein